MTILAFSNELQPDSQTDSIIDLQIVSFSGHIGSSCCGFDHRKTGMWNVQRSLGGEGCFDRLGDESAPKKFDKIYKMTVIQEIFVSHALSLSEVEYWKCILVNSLPILVCAVKHCRNAGVSDSTDTGKTYIRYRRLDLVNQSVSRNEFACITAMLCTLRILLYNNRLKVLCVSSVNRQLITEIYSLTVTQVHASATKRVHKFRNRSYFSRGAKRIYEKIYYSHASSVVSTVTSVGSNLILFPNGKRFTYIIGLPSSDVHRI
ncbi:hypothetical protein CLF_102680 [Clonorchis sinensis]|uniref:Uncharacterized protein n=1 Tax=Clonorchis sinensis TaxID=79923 RepID=G7YN53_CLOSI|nr:hypothetical protein CLF_102680 [Clonorchis sinensis]